MGEAKRRKLSDQSWGKTSQNSWEYIKESRKEARLISKIKCNTPDIPEKLAGWTFREAEQLTESQQDELFALVDELNANFKSQPDEWLPNFLVTAKSRTHPEVFEIFYSFVLASLSLS